MCDKSTIYPGIKFKEFFLLVVQWQTIVCQITRKQFPGQKRYVDLLGANNSLQFYTTWSWYRLPQKKTISCANQIYFRAKQNLLSSGESRERQILTSCHIHRAPHALKQIHHTGYWTSQTCNLVLIFIIAQHSRQNEHTVVTDSTTWK